MARLELRERSNRSNARRDKRALIAKRSKLLFYLKKGLNVKDSCVLAGISDYILGQLRSDPDFEELLKQSELNYKIELVEYVEDAASCGTWQAAAWLLERKYADEFGKKNTVKHEYEIKLANFQQAVLDVVNAASPQLKHEIVQKLRNLDLEDPSRQLAYNQGSVIDAEVLN